MLIAPLVPALALRARPLAGACCGAAAARRRKIGKPRPAPPGRPTCRRFRRPYFDETLAIGGDDVKARKVETRLTVEVRVNGRGPYSFVVDSGADTSVVGLRIARDLQLPLGTPAILNGMTARNIVDRVRVDRADPRPEHDPQPAASGAARRAISAATG